MLNRSLNLRSVDEATGSIANRSVSRISLKTKSMKSFLLALASIVVAQSAIAAPFPVSQSAIADVRKYSESDTIKYNASDESIAKMLGSICEELDRGQTMNDVRRIQARYLAYSEFSEATKGEIIDFFATANVVAIVRVCPQFRQLKL